MVELIIATAIVSGGVTTSVVYARWNEKLRVSGTQRTQQYRGCCGGHGLGSVNLHMGGRQWAITVATYCPREQSQIKVNPTQVHDHHNHSAYHICCHKNTQMKKTTSPPP